MYGGKFGVQNRLGWLVVGRKFTIFALFYFAVTRGQIPNTSPPPPVTVSILKSKSTANKDLARSAKQRLCSMYYCILTVTI